MREKYLNGYGLDQNEYDALTNKFYDYEEYIKTNNNIYENNYNYVKTLLDDISNNKIQDINFKNAVLGWYYSFLYIPREIHTNSIQLAITDECQLKCKHCYNQNNKRTNTFLTVNDIDFIYKKLLEIENKTTNNITNKKQIVITGGEPTLNSYIISIIDYFYKENFSVELLSNGIFISDEIIDKLKEKNDSIVQISFDGMKETHNFIRGEGSFEKSLSTVNKLIKNNIKVHIAFTANHYNYQEFPKLVNFFKDTGINGIWQDRYVKENNFELLPLSLEETNKFIENNNKLNLLNTNNFRVGSHKFLQKDRNKPCSAGYSIVIDCFGNLKACGRLNIKIANLFDNTTDEIIYKIKMFLIKFRSCPVKCFNCKKIKTCFGGSCCVSFAKNNKANIKDFCIKDKLC